MPRISPLALLLTVALLVSPRAAAAADKTPASASSPNFESQILPIFKAHCTGCHSGTRPKAGLDLSSHRGVLTGSKRGAVVRLNAAESSRLWSVLASDKMPPKGPRLTATQKGLVRTWINTGAVGATPKTGTVNTNQLDDIRLEDLSDDQRNFWAFQTPRRPPVPGDFPPQDADNVRNPIDAFIVATLQQHQLQLSPQADPATLLRRLSFDLTGLPPSRHDLARFQANTSPDAYRYEVDRLLASPAYGERWGRHWLDTAGYADSAGVLSADVPLPFTWRYRDYVIGALNANKPYDRFLHEQLAGDELTEYWRVYETAKSLPTSVVEGLVATGFLRMAADASRPDFKTIKNADALYHYPTLNDTLQIVASTTLGLTIHCARCHSHKFDPISQVDYYRLQAIFMPALRPKQWIPQVQRRLLSASAQQKKDAVSQNAQVDANVKRIAGQLKTLNTSFAKKLFDRRLAKLPEQIRADVAKSVQLAAADRSPVQLYLAAKFASHLRPDNKALAIALPAEFPDFARQSKTLQTESAQWQRRRVHFDEIRALYDLPGDSQTPLLRRGDPLTPGPLVGPEVPVMLRTAGSLDWSPPPKTARTSGRRLAFARWLTHPDHPLTARVMVNRIWMHHFGQGIVSTPDDFGSIGAIPSHPRLFDWLSREFIESGWDIKHIHRLILLSAVYRQVSRPDPQVIARSEAVDPDNLFLWRQRLRRLGAEPFRDAVLAVSGRLDPRPFGAALRVARRPDGEVNMADGQPDNRRSIYIQILRLNPQTLLQAFDQPTIEINCARRSQSTVATQALTLWNSRWMEKAAEAFASRVQNNDNQQVARRAIGLAYSRSATDEELGVIDRFLARQSQNHRAGTPGKAIDEDTARHKAITDLCHMLLASNEFAYID